MSEIDHNIAHPRLFNKTGKIAMKRGERQKGRESVRKRAKQCEEVNILTKHDNIEAQKKSEKTNAKGERTSKSHKN